MILCTVYYPVNSHLSSFMPTVSMLQILTLLFLSSETVSIHSNPIKTGSIHSNSIVYWEKKNNHIQFTGFASLCLHLRGRLRQCAFPPGGAEVKLSPACVRAQVSSSQGEGDECVNTGECRRLRVCTEPVPNHLWFFHRGSRTCH